MLPSSGTGFEESKLLVQPRHRSCGQQNSYSSIVSTLCARPLACSLRTSFWRGAARRVHACCLIYHMCCGYDMQGGSGLSA